MTNLVVFSGRPTKILELKTSKNGNEYLKFYLAVNFYLKESITSYIPVVIFGKKAKMIVNNLKDNGRLSIEGMLLNNNYTTSAGDKVYGFYVLASKVNIFDFKDKEREDVAFNNDKEIYSNDIIDVIYDDEFYTNLD